MKGTAQTGDSTSQNGNSILPLPVPTDPTDIHSPDRRSEDSFSVDASRLVPEDETPTADIPADGGELVVPEHDKTVISQRPIAAPDEFLRSMPLTELANLLEGKQLDHFQVEKMIGGGGMGAVFRGRDMRLDRTVAIKVIPASKRDADTLRRFRQEAQSAARLDHPNIARVYYVGEAERWNYIVFEFIAGVNVRDLVDIGGPLSIDDAVYYTRQVAEALQHAHERSVVHRDIKPSNVLVTPEGIAKVVDMGLARDTSMDKSTADATASGVTLGTFDYISPEQARNPRDADVRSDLYSLGCTLFFMLTGNPPFPEGTALQKLLNHGSQPPPDPRSWRDDMSDDLYEILMKMMAKRPADRYQRPQDLINDLLLLAESEDLPRSRTPGTFLLTPGLAQRSILEANLPWIVGLGVLLGSTLWLQSVQTLSSSFKIPDATFESTQIAASNVEPAAATITPSGSSTSGKSIIEPPRTTEGNAVADNEAQIASGRSTTTQPPRLAPDAIDPNEDSLGGESNEPVNSAKAVSTLVVSERMPVGIDRNAWSNSLSSALRRAEVEPDIRVIELVGKNQIDTILKINRPDLVLRGANQNYGRKAEAQIEFAPALVNRLQNGDALIEVYSAALQCLDIDFDIRLNADSSQGDLSLFQIHRGGKLELDGCRVTFRGSPMAPMSYAVTIQDGDAESASENPRTNRGFTDTSSSSKPSKARAESNHPASIAVKNCVVRGELSFVRVASSCRIELEIKQSLLAITGSAIDVRAVAAEDRLPPTMRVYCNRSTLATAEGFAKLIYRKDSVASLKLNRLAKDCVFWSLPGKPHILVEGLQRVDELDDLLHLHGGENAYAAQVDQLCRCRSRDLVDKSFAFTGQEPDWFQEFGNEWSVSWTKTPPPVEAFAEALEDAFRVVDGMFMPGYTPRKSPNMGD